MLKLNRPGGRLDERGSQRNGRRVIAKFDAPQCPVADDMARRRFDVQRELAERHGPSVSSVGCPPLREGLNLAHSETVTRCVTLCAIPAPGEFVETEMNDEEHSLEDQRQDDDGADLLVAIAKGLKAVLHNQALMATPGGFANAGLREDIARTSAIAIDDLDLTLATLAQVRADEAQVPLAPWTDELEPEDRRALATAVGRLLYWRDADGFRGVGALADAMAFVCAENRPAIGGEVPAASVVFRQFLDDCNAVEKGYPGEGVDLMRSAIRGLAIVIRANRAGRLAAWFRALDHFARMKAAEPDAR